MSSFITYNCHGSFKRRLPYIQPLYNKHSIICIQEHWLLNDQLNSLCSIQDDCKFVAKSGVDSDCGILTGRPYGGIAIVWHPEIDNAITLVETDSKRVCAIKLLVNDAEYLIFNVYMPCDNYGNNVVNDEYVTIFNEISSIYDQCFIDNIIEWFSGKGVYLVYSQY